MVFWTWSRYLRVSDDYEPGPATGPPGDHPDGTLTRRGDPAFRTYHERQSTGGGLADSCGKRSPAGGAARSPLGEITGEGVVLIEEADTLALGSDAHLGSLDGRERRGDGAGWRDSRCILASRLSSAESGFAREERGCGMVASFARPSRLW